LFQGIFSGRSPFFFFRVGFVKLDQLFLQVFVLLPGGWAKTVLFPAPPRGPRILFIPASDGFRLADRIGRSQFCPLKQIL